MPREGCLQDDGTTQSQSLVHGGPGVSKPFISGFLALVPSPFLFATFTGRLCPGPDHFRYGTAGEICTKGPGPFGWGNLGPGSRLSGPCTVGSSSPPPLTPPPAPPSRPPHPGTHCRSCSLARPRLLQSRALRSSRCCRRPCRSNSRVSRACSTLCRSQSRSRRRSSSCSLWRRER